MTGRAARRRYVILAAFVSAVIASTLALNNMSSLTGLIVIAPGYLVQAWLFERHWALGGWGYRATMIGVSSVFWTAVLVLVLQAAAYLVRRLSP